VSRPDRRDRNAVLRCDILLAAALVFLVLTTIAMGVYSGSQNLNHATRGYSFTVNFFSDLGATRTYSHHLNVASAVLFIIALSGVGLAIILFSLNAPLVAKPKGRRESAGRIATVTGVISGIAFVGIAAVPWNISEGLHELFVQIAFGFLLLFVVLLVAMQVSNSWSPLYIVPNVLYLVLLAAYVALLFFGPNIDTLRGLEVQAIGQKVIVYSSIINVAFQAFGLRRFLVSAPADLAEES
jgi:hypothetical protein